jgi:hypothetical protein
MHHMSASLCVYSTYKIWVYDEEEGTYPVDPIARLDEVPFRGTVRIERYIDENSAEGRKLKQQRQMQRMREKRTHIARELLHTEREYVKNMNILLEVGGILWLACMLRELVHV